MEQTQPKTKVCSRCHKRKRRHLMVQTRALPDGLGYWCKACMRDYTRERRENQAAIDQDRWNNRTYARAQRELQRRYPEEFEQLLIEVRERESA